MSEVDLSEFLPPPKQTRCKFGTGFHDMTDAQREKVTAVLERTDVTSERIATVVSGWGFPVSEDVTRRHRQGRCCCD